MDWLRRISDFLLGERGSRDIEITRSPQTITFRLPNQQPRFDARLTVLIILILAGGYGVFLVVNGTLQFAEDRRNYLGMIACVSLIVCAVLLLFARMRFGWHYEIALKPNELSVYYVTSGIRFRTVFFELEPVRQLTIVRKGPKSLLQAEGADESVRLILREQPHDVLVRLANALAEERSIERPHSPVVSVAVEDPAQVDTNRTHAPLSSGILYTRHETGVTFDFPLPPDPREHYRRRAWRLFEVGILMLIGTLVLFVLRIAADWDRIHSVLLLPFIAGLVCLVSASGQSWKAWQDDANDADLRQLSVVGNMLIRTTRDHQKKIWYRDEICALVLAERAFENTHFLVLLAHLSDGKDVVLHRIDAAAAQADYRPKAELEWIATELRQALFDDFTASSRTTSEAIQEIGARARDTQITD